MAIRRIENFLIRLARKADTAALIPLVAETLQDEPVSRLVSKTAEQNQEEARLTAELLFESHSARTWIVEDASTKQMVSFLSTADFTDDYMSNELLDLLTCYYGKFMEMQDELEERYRVTAGFFQRPMPSGHTRYIRIGGTLAAYRRRNIQTWVAQLALQDAEEFGYRCMASISTSRFSRALSLRLGINPIFSAPFKHWTDNAKVLAELESEGHVAAYFIRKDIQ